MAGHSKSHVRTPLIDDSLTEPKNIGPASPSHASPQPDKVLEAQQGQPPCQVPAAPLQSLAGCSWRLAGRGWVTYGAPQARATLACPTRRRRLAAKCLTVLNVHLNRSRLVRSRPPAFAARCSWLNLVKHFLPIATARPIPRSRTGADRSLDKSYFPAQGTLLLPHRSGQPFMKARDYCDAGLLKK
jgi:hypothetical protein